MPVPAPKPNFSKEGDLACSLPGDRSTFCFGIKSTPGEYGREIYALLSQVIARTRRSSTRATTSPARASSIPEQLRLAAWRILNPDAYIAAVEAKLRAPASARYVEKGDILKVKQVSRGNIFHEEMDIVQNPASGGSYVSFVIKDRCHNAGF